MAGAIWSMPSDDVMKYPIKSLFEFFNNHKLLHGKRDRPKWKTVSNGSISYVKKLISFLSANPKVKIEKNIRILGIERNKDCILIKDSNNNSNKFDHIIFSTNPSKTLEILSDADNKEIEILKNFSTNKNIAYLHNDASLMPTLKKTWSAWNVFIPKEEKKNISVTYWMNKLQNIKEISGLVDLVKSKAKLS